VDGNENEYIYIENLVLKFIRELKIELLYGPTSLILYTEKIFVPLCSLQQYAK
jgi:hypothetical protein